MTFEPLLLFMNRGATAVCPTISSGRGDVVRDQLSADANAVRRLT